MAVWSFIATDEYRPWRCQKQLGQHVGQLLTGAPVEVGIMPRYDEIAGFACEMKGIDRIALKLHPIKRNLMSPAFLFVNLTQANTGLQRLLLELLFQAHLVLTCSDAAGHAAFDVGEVNTGERGHLRSFVLRQSESILPGNNGRWRFAEQNQYALQHLSFLFESERCLKY